MVSPSMTIAPEHLFDGVALLAELVAHVFADRHARYGDDRGEPHEEDGQDGFAAGFARGDQAHQHVDQQDQRNQHGQYAEACDPDRNGIAQYFGCEEGSLRRR